VSCMAEGGRKGGAALLTKRDGGGLRAFDDLAVGLESGTISRRKAIKLGGAALVASALALFASEDAQAQEVEIAISRRRCNRKYTNSDFCRNRRGDNCEACCNRNSRRPKACCGRRGCNCCRRNQRCADSGECQ
jgi:hypothetical protein